MAHGSEEYFSEIARFERRLSLMISTVSVVLLACELALFVPGLRHALLQDLLPRSPRRFGFEGPEQFVRRIILESSGPAGPHPGAPTLVYRSMRAVKGGRPDTRPSQHPNARPDTRRIGVGAGESSQDLVTRARILYGGSAPVMQSEDLIIEKLVKPSYPEDARDRGIEGLVALVALVDTTGTVTKVDLMSSPGEPVLEEAATAAVYKCRFRPYRVRGRLSEVYAVFRFNFRIY